MMSNPCFAIRPIRLLMMACGIVAMLATASACGSDDDTLSPVPSPPNNGGPTNGTGTEVLRTVLGARQVEARQRFGVTCIWNNSNAAASGRASGLDFDIVPNDASFLIDRDGTATEGRLAYVTPTRAGQYTIRCRSRDSRWRDTNGARITVVAGNPTRVVPVLLDTPDVLVQTIHAGDVRRVGCEGRDQDGNRTMLLEAATLSASRAAEITLTRAGEYAVRPTVAGSYVLTCTAATLMADTVLTLNVLPATPTRVIADVTPQLVPAGDQVWVHCRVVDAFNNTIPDAASTYDVVTDAGTVVPADRLFRDELGLRMHRAGGYNIFCRMPVSGQPDLEMSAPLTVEAGPAVDWVVDASLFAEQRCVEQQLALPVIVQAHDAYGNLVEAGQVVWTAVPNRVRVATDGRAITFLDDGVYELTGTYVGPHADGVTLPPVVIGGVHVDSKPPEIVINHPARGAMLTKADTDHVVGIDGMVTDATSGVRMITVENQPVDLSHLATPPLAMAISHDKTNSAWGLNVITAVAEDTCGNRRTYKQSYLQSAAYGPVAVTSQPTARIPQSMVAYASPDVLDDHNRNDVDDLATIAEVTLQAQDINRVIPDRLWITPDNNNDGVIDTTSENCIFVSRTLTRTGLVLFADKIYPNPKDPSRNAALRFTGPQIETIQSVNGGMRVRVSVQDFEFALRGEGTLNMGCIIGNQYVTESGSVRAKKITADVTLHTGVQNSISHTTLDDSDIALSFDCTGSGRSACPYIQGSWGQMQNIVDRFLDIAADKVRGEAEKSLKETMIAQLPGLIDNFLQNDSLISKSFRLPSPINKTLSVEASVDNILLSAADGVRVSMASQLYQCGGESARLRALNPKGPMRHALLASPPAVTLAPGTFGVAVKDDVINQALWSAWYGGAFDMTLPDWGNTCGARSDECANALNQTVYDAVVGAIGLDVMDAFALTIRPMLPPVLLPAQPGSNANLTVGLGDVYIEGTVDLSKLPSAWLNAVGAGGGVAGNAPPNGLSLPAEPIHVRMYATVLWPADIQLDTQSNALALQVLAKNSTPVFHLQSAAPVDDFYSGYAVTALQHVLTWVVPSLVGDVLERFPLPVVRLPMLPGTSYQVQIKVSQGVVERTADRQHTLVRGMSLQQFIPVAAAHEDGVVVEVTNDVDVYDPISEVSSCPQ